MVLRRKIDFQYAQYAQRFPFVLRMGMMTSKLFDTLEWKQNRLAFFCIKSFYQFLFEVTIGRAWAQTTSKGSFPRWLSSTSRSLGFFTFKQVALPDGGSLPGISEPWLCCSLHLRQTPQIGSLPLHSFIPTFIQLFIYF